MFYLPIRHVLPGKNVLRSKRPLSFIFCHLDVLGIHMNESILFTINGFTTTNNNNNNSSYKAHNTAIASLCAGKEKGKEREKEKRAAPDIVTLNCNILGKERFSKVT